MHGGQAVADIKLARDAIGLREVLFQSMTFMGLAATVVATLPLTMAFAGGATIIAGLLCLVALLTVALSIAALAKHMPTAGSFYTYASQGIHPTVGFLVGWLYTLFTVLVEPIMVLILATALVGTQPFSRAPGLWWIYAVAVCLIVWGLTYRGIKMASVTNTVLGSIEIGLLLVLSIWLIVAAGDRNTLEVFSLKYANVPGYTGFGGVVVGMVFTVLAFGGFESSAPLAEESRTPRKTVGRAVVLALILVVAIELTSVYAATVFYGPSKMYQFSQIGGGIGAAWEQMAQQIWGPAGVVLIVLAIINSTVANTIAGANASTRTLYAFGRIRVLPAALAAVQPRWRSPHIAVHVQLVIGVAITLALGFAYGPYMAFAIVGTIIGILLALLYMSINVSCFLYYWRRQRTEFNVIRHAVIPAIGFLMLIPVLCAGAGIPLFSFISPLNAPLSYAGAFVLFWMLVGVVYAAYLRARAPAKLRETATVFLAEESELAAEEAGMVPEPAP